MLPYLCPFTFIQSYEMLCGQKLLFEFYLMDSIYTVIRLTVNLDCIPPERVKLKLEG